MSPFGNNEIGQNEQTGVRRSPNSNILHCVGDHESRNTQIVMANLGGRMAGSPDDVGRRRCIKSTKEQSTRAFRFNMDRKNTLHFSEHSGR